MTKRLMFAFVILAACGGDDDSQPDAEPPVAHSAPVGVTLSLKSGDVNAGAASKEKKLDSESGDPYKAFIEDARNALGGNDPSRISIASATLILGAETTGVIALDEVFTGDVEVVFILDDTNNTYKAGHVADPMGGGPVDLTVDFDHSLLGPMDRTNFLKSDKTRVVIRGPAAPGFGAANADAKLQVTFTFQAFE